MIDFGDFLIIIIIGGIIEYFIEKKKKEDFEFFKNMYLIPDTYDELDSTSLKKLKKRSKKISDMIEGYICSMNYYDFLKTPYWKIISEKVKKKSKYRCQRCGSRNNLEVHHITYDNHGREHIFWKEDLICLCSICHRSKHKQKFIG